MSFSRSVTTDRSTEEIRIDSSRPPSSITGYAKGRMGLPPHTLTMYGPRVNVRFPKAPWKCGWTATFSGFSRGRALQVTSPSTRAVPKFMYPGLPSRTPARNAEHRAPPSRTGGASASAARRPRVARRNSSSWRTTKSRMLRILPTEAASSAFQCCRESWTMRSATGM